MLYVNHETKCGCNNRNMYIQFLTVVILCLVCANVYTEYKIIRMSYVDGNIHGPLVHMYTSINKSCLGQTTITVYVYLPYCL